MVLRDAYDAAQQLLSEQVRPGLRDEVVIAEVSEHPSAWSFADNTRRFIEADDLSAALAGNGPVVVPKDGSPPYLAGSATPVEEQLP